eukprot:Gregarina_sp_Poly_1__3111@NODE_1876_length_3153_cov_184_290992_g1217_i0_p3_GENE_NODE_1876_length_3153_cov_184_290992_g1217_i0NODE_1876_length_3153_cov_184_290992_g1217_i0_p3_ORF_typecomplete_len147_score18_92Gpatch/PF01585_23/4_7e14Gpatch_2/PF12656_7/5_7e09DUF4286/PF14114_6/0_081Treslin_N/PF15292_6/0_19IMUP/PF15761_5/0_38_NODE_1876_length_3153_cov_184_290992_g1217_i0108548
MKSPEAHAAGYGAAFLKKFGWKEGEGLGPQKNGITEPLQLRKRTENLGLGAEKEKAKEWDSWWEDVYNQHAMNSNQRSSANKYSCSSSSNSSSDSDEHETARKRAAAPCGPNRKSIHDLTGPELLRICRYEPCVPLDITLTVDDLT